MTIYLIFTTSLENKHGPTDLRRQTTYLHSIRQTLSWITDMPEIRPILVENNGFRATYLDIFQETDPKCCILYTDNNSLGTETETGTYIHKGVNEWADLKSVVQTYGIQDDDVVIKLTGRYEALQGDFFRQIVQDVSEEYDAWIKFANICGNVGEFDSHNCILGLFAIRAKWISKFEYRVDQFAIPEIDFATFVRENIQEERICSIPKLHLRCHQMGGSWIDA